MHYNAELIAVGTELLLGNIANTDAQMISEGLSTLGIDVYYHTVVGDNPQRLREALDIARRRANIIITTGGLGPTYDDLTKQTICEAFGRPLELHEDIWQGIQDYFARRMKGGKITENNKQQAMLPVGCTVFENPVGTAPGCAFEEGGVHVLMLPGPPYECRYMFEHQAVPYLQGLTRERIFSRESRILGSGESQVEAGSAVVPGQLLISGVVEDGFGRSTLHHARGMALARTRRAVRISIPMRQTVSTPTGEVVERESVQLLGLSIPISFAEKPEGDFQRETETRTIQVQGIELPVTVFTERWVGIETEEVTLTEEQAQQKAEQEFEKFCQEQWKDIKVVSHTGEGKLNGDVYQLEITCVCEENIAVESEILLN